MLPRPKLIIINISVCNVIDHISGLGTNFLMSQKYEENILVIYLMLIVLNLTTSY